MTTLESTLWVSLISIVVLFASCAVIWGLMALLAKIPGSKEAPEEEVETEEDIPTLADGVPAPEKGSRQKQQAAAVAVAVALAMKSRSRVIPTAESDDTAFSAWKAVQRASSMSQRNGIFSRKSRG